MPSSAIPYPATAMKATLTDRRFSDPNWIYERKLDGIRCLAYRDAGAVTLESRNRLALNQRYPGVVAALESDPRERFVLDGEVVAFGPDRMATFEALQRSGRDPRMKVALYVFDVLWLDGDDLRDAPLRRRKAALRSAVRFADPIRLTPYRRAEGEAYYEQACRRGWEGVIAKRFDSPYRGARSGDWLKFKCAAEQEVVIGGYTAPKGSREAFGALLIGVHETAGGPLRYAGKVGTGFDATELKRLHGLMSKLERTTSPFDAGDPPTRGVTWVEPQLVAQAGFTEWTRDGRMRHPRYLGLREDKPAREVVRERPA